MQRKCHHTTSRSVIKNNIFQDNCLQEHHSTTSVSPLQDHSTGVALLHDHNSKSVAPSQDHLSLEDIKDILTLIKHSPLSFDVVDNMPGEYSIHLDHRVPPVQHPRCNIPIHYREKIEKTLKEMEDLQTIAPVTRPTKWISLLTYHTKPDGSLRICLDLHDLNKAIIREHYKAPTSRGNFTMIIRSPCVFKKGMLRIVFWVFIWTLPPPIEQPSIPT